GSTRFYLSLEDPLMRLFGGQKIAGMMDFLNVDESLPITNPIVTRAIEGAQRKVESYHFDMRKNILQYDDVLTEQRQLIYDQRRKVLEGHNLRQTIVTMIQKEMKRVIASHLTPEGSFEDWEPEVVQEMLHQIHAEIPRVSHCDLASIQGKSYGQLIEFFQQEGVSAYELLEKEMSDWAESFQREHGVTISGFEEEEDPDHAEALSKLSETELAEVRHPLRRIERDILLKVVDDKWIDYLHNLDALREGIGLRAYGQKDPLIEYKREAFEMFQQLSYDIERETIALLFHARIEVQWEQQMETQPPGLEYIETALTDAMQHAQYIQPPEDMGISDEYSTVHVVDSLGHLERMDSEAISGELLAESSSSLLTKPGKNDECPCGSGKKYTKCHGV
ncbi:MAG: SEC-C domain-containing protein, partial [Cyanobacteria bacterium]|nr:SEC-C domain-containing protein [Cyanobacteriota bacterium]